MFERPCAVIENALGRRFTGAVLRVEQRGQLLFERAFGRVSGGAGARPVYVDSRFDIASLTKPFVATAALQAVSAGLLRLDEPLAGVVPEWRGLPQATITLRHLLAHTSGMQSGADYRLLRDEDVERYALARELAAPVGERVIYSDLGFIALGVVLARAGGRALREIVARTARRAGCRDVDFRPSGCERPAIPATEEDDWRGRVQGQVHDEKAYLMGGVAGHAGLFASARDVARLTELYLAGPGGREQAAIDAGLAFQAISHQADDEVLRRGLGWALKTRDDNSCGPLMSPRTFGHTGFVGTCVWADPARDLQIVFLTNSVYFGRVDLRDVRSEVCTAVIEDVAT